MSVVKILMIMQLGLFISSAVWGQFVVKEGTNEYLKVDKTTGTVTVENHLQTNSFQLTDGSQGTNKYLTSDANGNATWQDFPQKDFLKVYINYEQSVNKLDRTDIKFNQVESFSVGGGNFNTTNGYYEVPRTGFYTVSATIQMELGTDNMSIFVIAVDGSGTDHQVNRGTTYQSDVDMLTGAHVTSTVYAQAGWRIKAAVFHNSDDGAKTLFKNASGYWENTNWMTIVEH